jgi:hypothetical protein
MPNLQLRVAVLILIPSLLFRLDANAFSPYVPPCFSTPISVTQSTFTRQALAPVPVGYRWLVRLGSVSIWSVVGTILFTQLGSRNGRNTNPDRYDAADELQLQRRLLWKKFFQKPLHLKRTTLRFGFAINERGDVSWETARQVADVMLTSEERLARDGELSPEQAELVRRHRVHFDGFARAIQRILRRNPWSLVTRDEEGHIVGIVITALVDAKTENDLPNSSVKMTFTHEMHRSQSRRRNTMVDIWYTGKTRDIANATLKGSFKLADLICAYGDSFTTIDDDHIIAYSNPRGLWKYGPHLVMEYAALVMWTVPGMTNGLHDIAISGHWYRGSELVRMIGNAFPKIFGQPGLGSGWAFMMRYFFKPKWRRRRQILAVPKPMLARAHAAAA